MDIWEFTLFFLLLKSFIIKLPKYIIQNNMLLVTYMHAKKNAFK